MHSACKPHLHLTHTCCCCTAGSALLPPPHSPPPSLPLYLPEGPAALDALHTQPGTFAARPPHPPPPPPLSVWRCEAGLCDALTPVIVSPKCKAVAPSCGQVFSWEFYSGKVPSGTHRVGVQADLAAGVQGQAVLTACLIWSANVCFNSPKRRETPRSFLSFKREVGNTEQTFVTGSTTCLPSAA